MINVRFSHPITVEGVEYHINQIVSLSDGLARRLRVAGFVQYTSQPVPPQPPVSGLNLEALLVGIADHGDVFSTLDIDPLIGTHAFDVIEPVTLTIADPPADIAPVVTLMIRSGATKVTWPAGVVFDLGEPTDDLTTVTLVRLRGEWVAPGGGSGGGEPAVPDTTPPTAVTGLVVTPNAEGTAATVAYNAATDAETTPKYRYRLYPNGTTAPAWPTSGAQYNLAVLSALTGLTPGTVYRLDVQAYSQGGSSAAATTTFTTPLPPGWHAFDTLTAAEIGADRSATTLDVTTTGGRTFHWENGYAAAVDVLGGYLRGPRNNADTGGGFPNNDGPTGDFAIEFDYTGLGDAGNGYLSSLGMNIGQPVGSLNIFAENDWRGDGTLAISISNTYDTQPVLTPGPGQTLRADGRSVAVGGSSGRMRFERIGQIVHVYRNGVLLLSADNSTANYGGNPNLLTVPGKFLGINAKNLLGLSNIVWETYT
jgi:hypothetical protein